MVVGGLVSIPFFPVPTRVCRPGSWMDGLRKADLYGSSSTRWGVQGVWHDYDCVRRVDGRDCTTVRGTACVRCAWLQKSPQRTIFSVLQNVPTTGHFTAPLVREFYASSRCFVRGEVIGVFLHGSLSPSLSGRQGWLCLTSTETGMAGGS